jgi:hypothetical protein
MGKQSEIALECHDDLDSRVLFNRDLVSTILSSPLNLRQGCGPGQRVRPKRHD